jgi:hypothetical protein
MVRAMGQYHRPVNVDRMECLSPHALGNGFKLMEFAMSGYGTMAALGLFLLGEGRWAGQRIGIIGDYHEPGDVPAELRAAGVHAAELWTTRQEFLEHHAGDAGRGSSRGPGSHPRDVSGEAARALVDAGMWTALPAGAGWVDAPVDASWSAPSAPPSWVVNLDRREVLVPECFGDSPNPWSFVADFGGGTMTALAVLLAASNGRGGGDLRSGDPLVGSWAFDRIGVVPRSTLGAFTDVSVPVRGLLEEAGEVQYRQGPDRTVVRTGWDGSPKVPEGTDVHRSTSSS